MYMGIRRKHASSCKDFIIGTLMIIINFFSSPQHLEACLGTPPPRRPGAARMNNKGPWRRK